MSVCTSTLLHASCWSLAAPRHWACRGRTAPSVGCAECPAALLACHAARQQPRRRCCDGVRAVVVGRGRAGRPLHERSRRERCALEQQRPSLAAHRRGAGRAAGAARAGAWNGQGLSRPPALAATSRLRHSDPVSWRWLTPPFRTPAGVRVRVGGGGGRRGAARGGCAQPAAHARPARSRLAAGHVPPLLHRASDQVVHACALPPASVPVLSANPHPRHRRS